jgi:hypothetical protein
MADVMTSNTQADRSIDSGDPFSQIVVFFSSRREAANYFAERQATLYGANRALDGNCDCCAAKDDVRTMVFTWQASIHPLYLAPIIVAAMAMKMHAVLHGYEVTFNTLHPLCEKCRRDFYRKRLLSVIFQLLGLFAIGIGGILAICWVFPPLFAVADITSRSDILHWGVLGLALILLGSMILLVRKKISALSEPMQTVGRNPFQLFLVTKTGG